MTQLSKHAVLKMSTTGEGRRAKIAARKALVRRLEAIVRTARVIVIGDDASDLDCFRLPPKLTDHMILMTGRVFVHHAEPFAPQFIALGMAPTFLADLIELVDGFEQAIHARRQAGPGKPSRELAWQPRFRRALRPCARSTSSWPMCCTVIR